MKKIIAICILTLFAANAVTPSVAWSSERYVRELRYDWKLDLAVTAIASTGWIVTQAAMNNLAPAKCRWCSVNGFDRWGHDNIAWSNTSTASRLSDAMAYGAAPLAAFGLDALASSHDGKFDGFLIDALVIAEAVALSQFTTQIVKIAVGRQRPYAHFGGGSTKPRDNISFYSGHTSLAFSLAVASGTVATMRGYRLAPVIWGAGLAIAGTASYLRLAADKHYLTDVIAGAAIGSAFGFAIPYLFHRPKDKRKDLPTISAIPADGGALLSVSGNW